MMDSLFVPGSSFLVDPQGQRGGTVVCGEPWYAELSPGALTSDDMARACGFWLSFFTHACSICTKADSMVPVFVELDQGNVGLMTRAVCAGCLPGVFEQHLREQAAMDALVEAVPHGEHVHAFAGAATEGGTR